LLKGIAGSVVSRAVGAVAPLLLIPVTLNYLGATVFGLWMTLTAAAALASFADLGLGNGLMTRVPPALAANDVTLARRYVSSAYALVIGVAALVTAGLWASLPFEPWNGVFDPKGSTDPGSINLLAVVVLMVFALNVPCGLVTRLYYAKQRAASAAMWQSAASIAPLLPVLLAVHLRASPLVVVLIATAAGPVVNGLNTVWFFTRVSPELRPCRSLVSWPDVTHMLRLGSQFFALTVALVVATNSDNLVVAQTLGLGAVTVFAVPARVYQQLGSLVSLVNVPLWSAHADALSRGERDWIRRVTLRMVVLSSVTIVAVAVPLAIFGPQLINLWTGQRLDIPLALPMGLAVWWCIMAALSPIFMVQNGAGVIRPQLVGWAAYAVLSILAKAFFAATVGLAAIPWVGTALLVVTVVPAAIVGYRRVMRVPGHSGQGAMVVEPVREP
jgi:O-antigen/teichoic acid export membrane protein